MASPPVLGTLLLDIFIASPRECSAVGVPWPRIQKTKLMVGVIVDITLLSTKKSVVR